jgi:hypothetical protein
VKELKTALKDITKELAEAVKTIQEFQKETLRDLKQFALDLKGILDQFSRDTNGVLVTVAEEIKRAVAESIRGMEAQREAFARSAALAAESFRGIREELEKSLDKQAELQKQMLQRVEASTRKVLEEANQAFISQSQTLITLGQEASALINQAAANLTTTLVNIDKMLQKTRITVEEQLEKFRVAYQESLTKFFEDQNNLLEKTLDKQREGLKEVIDELRKVFLEDAPKMGYVIKEAMEKMQETMRYMQATIADMQATLAAIQDTAKILYNVANKTGLTSADRLQQLHEIIRELGSEANQIESACQNMVEKFDQALKIGNAQLMEYLQRANEAYLKSIEEGDRAAAEVCKQLNQTSHGLMDVSHYLVASAKNLKNGNGSAS